MRRPSAISSCRETSQSHNRKAAQMQHASHSAHDPTGRQRQAEVQPCLRLPSRHLHEASRRGVYLKRSDAQGPHIRSEGVAVAVVGRLDHLGRHPVRRAHECAPVTYTTLDPRQLWSSTRMGLDASTPRGCNRPSLSCGCWNSAAPPSCLRVRRSVMTAEACKPIAATSACGQGEVWMIQHLRTRAG